MQFDCIRIYGPHWREVGRLLTDLLEAEAEHSESGDSVRITSGPFSWELLDGENNDSQHAQEFRISVGSEEELEEIRNRSEFLSFTNPNSITSLTHINEAQFTLVDGNGGRWVFRTQQ